MSPNSSDDLCLFFCLDPSSVMVLQEESILKSKYEQVNVTVYQEMNKTMEIPLRQLSMIT